MSDACIRLRMQARFANSPQSARPLARRRQGEFPLPEGQTSGCLLLFLINEKEIAPQQGCFCFGEATHVGRLHSLANASPVRKFAAERPPACEAAARRISLARRANFRVLASFFNKRKRNRTPTGVLLFWRRHPCRTLAFACECKPGSQIRRRASARLRGGGKANFPCPKGKLPGACFSF